MGESKKLPLFALGIAFGLAAAGTEVRKGARAAFGSVRRACVTAEMDPLLVNGAPKLVGQ